MAMSPSMAQHFLDHDHKQHVMKLAQLRLVLIAFLVSIGLNLVKVVVILATQHPVTCMDDTRYLIDEPIDVILVSFENLSQIFPHIMIPLILWYIPSKTNNIA